MMAGGSHSKFTGSSSHRKSRWESSSSNSKNTTNLPPADPKSADQKRPNLNPIPSPKNPNPNPKTTGPSPKKPAKSLSIPPSGHPPAPTFPFQPHDLAPPPLPPPPPPSYGFHKLERRTISLADGSVRSYFALPPDYQDLPVRRPPIFPRFPPLGGPRFPPDDLAFQNGPSNPNKRKFGSEEEYRFSNNNIANGFYHPDQFMAGTSASNSSSFRPGKYLRIGDNSNNKHIEVDEAKLNKMFLHFAKLINETEGERKRYLENGKQGRLSCIACGRSSKDFPDTHALVMHTYSSDNADLRVDHLGLHKALCVLMGWNFSKPPDNAKIYQFLPADEAAANQNDLVMWPPTVMIHNTITGKGKDGRMEGLGNKAMDSKIRDLGFPGGKSKSLYGREGHLGITLIKFSPDQLGLKEALRLAEHFAKENRGRRAWGRIQPVALGKDDEKNPNLVRVEHNGDKKKILYGYLATASDLYKLDFDTRKKVTVESQRKYKASK